MSEADEALPSIAYAVPSFDENEVRGRRIIGWAFAVYGAVGAALSVLQFVIGLGLLPISIRINYGMRWPDAPLYVVSLAAQVALCVGGFWMQRSAAIGPRLLLRLALVLPPLVGMTRLMLQAGGYPATWTFTDRLLLMGSSVLSSATLAATLIAMTYVVPTRRD